MDKLFADIVRGDATTIGRIEGPNNLTAGFLGWATGSTDDGAFGETPEQLFRGHSIGYDYLIDADGGVALGVVVRSKLPTPVAATLTPDEAIELGSWLLSEGKAAQQRAMPTGDEIETLRQTRSDARPRSTVAFVNRALQELAQVKAEAREAVRKEYTELIRQLATAASSDDQAAREGMLNALLPAVEKCLGDR